MRKELQIYHAQASFDWFCCRRASVACRGSRAADPVKDAELDRVKLVQKVRPAVVGDVHEGRSRPTRAAVSPAAGRASSSTPEATA